MRPVRCLEHKQPALCRSKLPTTEIFMLLSNMFAAFDRLVSPHILITGFKNFCWWLEQLVSMMSVRHREAVAAIVECRMLTACIQFKVYCVLRHGLLLPEASCKFLGDFTHVLS